MSQPFKGGTDVRLCPYKLCGKVARVRTIPAYPTPDGKPAHKIFPQHDIVNPYISGPCPMSLQEVSWAIGGIPPHDVYNMLQERLRVDRDRIIAATVQDEPPTATARPKSTSLRGPHRIGREPVTEEDKKDWQLGGREDEDSGHLSPPDMAKPHPRHVQGVSGNVASVEEVVATLTSAALHGGEAAQAVQAAIGSMDEAIGKLSEQLNDVVAAQGQSNAVILTEYYGIINEAQEKAHMMRDLGDEIISRIVAGTEKGEELTGRMLG